MADVLDDLFRLADAYVAASGQAESTLSRLMLSGGNRLRDLRAGKGDIGNRRIKTAIIWLSEHWPEGRNWPEGIDRPDSETISDSGPVE